MINLRLTVFQLQPVLEDSGLDFFYHCCHHRILFAFVRSVHLHVFICAMHCLDLQFMFSVFSIELNLMSECTKMNQKVVNFVLCSQTVFIGNCFCSRMSPPNTWITLLPLVGIDYTRGKHYSALIDSHRFLCHVVLQHNDDVMIYIGSHMWLVLARSYLGYLVSGHTCSHRSFLYATQGYQTCLNIHTC